MSGGKWEIIFPDDQIGYPSKLFLMRRGAMLPGGRDIWGGGFACRSSAYIFGGAYTEYGPATHWSDLTTLGVSNDLWRFDMPSRTWTLLHPNDGSREYGPRAEYPGARVLPSVCVLGVHAYMFGGLTVLCKGWEKNLALNDFWRYDIKADSWEQLHPDTGSTDYGPGLSYPGLHCAQSAIATDNTIYFFGGWSGTTPAVLTNDFWRYDTRRDEWEQLHPNDGSNNYSPNAKYPGIRYCASIGVYNGLVYLFSGRNTTNRDPEFFNDLWRYDLKKNLWTQLQPDDGADDFTVSAKYPPGRYASGFATLGPKLYVFGGHSYGEMELNDFWIYDMAKNSWNLLQPHDGSTDYSVAAVHPGVRRVPTMVAVGPSLILFGGLNLFSGPREHGYVRALNDLWLYTPTG